MPHLTIGRLSQHTGCKVETIRYYERAGLMPPPPRSPGGHRVYDETHLRRLTFLRRGRGLGFSLDQLRALLGLVDEGGLTCGEVQAVTLDRLADVRGKIADLKRLEGALATMAAECAGGTVPDCPVIDALFQGAA